MDIFLLDYSGGTAIDLLDRLIHWFYTDPTTPVFSRSPEQQAAISRSNTPLLDRQFGSLSTFATPTNYSGSPVAGLRMPNTLEIQQIHKDNAQRAWDDLVLTFIAEYNQAVTAIGDGDPGIPTPTAQQEQDFLDLIAQSTFNPETNRYEVDTSALFSSPLDLFHQDLLVKTELELSDQLYFRNYAAMTAAKETYTVNGQALLYSREEDVANLINLNLIMSSTVNGIPLSDIPESTKIIKNNDFLLLLVEEGDPPVLQEKKAKSKNLDLTSKNNITVTNETTIEVNLLKNNNLIQIIDLTAATKSPIDITFKEPDAEVRKVDRIADCFIIQPHPSNTINLRFPNGVKFPNGEGRGFQVAPADGEQVWTLRLYNDWNQGRVTIDGIGY